MIGHYVIYREEYDRFGGEQESPNMTSEKVKGKTKLECLVRVLGLVKSSEDEAEEAIEAGEDSMQDFVDEVGMCNGDGDDFIIIFDVDEDKEVFPQ